MNENENRYWYMHAKGNELIQELNGELRTIRLVEPRGDAICATFWELMVRSIPLGGVLQVLPGSKYSSIDDVIAALIGRTRSETQKILQVLVKYEYLIPFKNGYVMPLVVKNLGKQNKPSAQQKQEARLTAKGNARLISVLTALGVRDSVESEDEMDSASNGNAKCRTCDNQDSGTTSTHEPKQEKKSQCGQNPNANPKTMDRYVQLISATLSSGENGENIEPILSLLKGLLDMGRDSQNNKE